MRPQPPNLKKSSKLTQITRLPYRLVGLGTKPSFCTQLQDDSFMIFLNTLDSEVYQPSFPGFSIHGTVWNKLMLFSVLSLPDTPGDLSELLVIIHHLYFFPSFKKPGLRLDWYRYTVDRVFANYQYCAAKRLSRFRRYYIFLLAWLFLHSPSLSMRLLRKRTRSLATFYASYYLASEHYHFLVNVLHDLLDAKALNPAQLAELASFQQFLEVLSNYLRSRCYFPVTNHIPPGGIVFSQGGILPGNQESPSTHPETIQSNLVQSQILEGTAEDDSSPATDVLPHDELLSRCETLAFLVARILASSRD